MEGAPENPAHGANLGFAHFGEQANLRGSYIPKVYFSMGIGALYGFDGVFFVFPQAECRIRVL